MRGSALIRPGRDEDAVGLIALIGACWADYPGCVLDVDAEVPELRALASFYASKGGALWVSGEADGMVAAAPLTPFVSDTGPGARGAAWEICRVYVDPRLHGAGLGPALLATAERHAIDAGATELVLWTDTRFRRAHRFYERHSYVRDGASRALHDLANTLEFRYAKPVNGVRLLDAAAAHSAERRLAQVLLDAADADGSAMTADQARAHWQAVTHRVGQRRATLLAAWCDGVLAGALQVGGTDANDEPPHGPFVHPELRHRGVAALLASAARDVQAAGTRSAG